MAVRLHITIDDARYQLLKHEFAPEGTSRLSTTRSERLPLTRQALHEAKNNSPD